MSDIIPSINSDHSAIFLQFISIEKSDHGPSFWKFNASLVDDEYFVTLINESVPKWLDEFSSVIEKRLLWDLIKYRIRQVAMKYSKEKARQRRKNISDIEASLRARFFIQNSGMRMTRMENVRVFLCCIPIPEWIEHHSNHSAPRGRMNRML